MKKLMTAMLLLCAAMWNVALAENVTITWQVKHGDDIVFTTETSEAVGSTVEAYPTTLDRDFVTLSGFEAFEVTEATTKELTATYSAYIEFATSLQTAKWYHMAAQNSSGNKYKIGADYRVTRAALDADDATFYWAFVGNPYSGLTIYNLSTWAKGTKYYLAHNNSQGKVVTDEDNYAYKVWSPMKSSRTDTNANQQIRFVANGKSLNGNSLPGLQGADPGWGNQVIVMYTVDEAKVAELKAAIEASVEYHVHFVVSDPQGNSLGEYDYITTEKTISSVPTGTGLVSVNYAVFDDFDPVTLDADNTTTIAVTAKWNNNFIEIASDVANAHWYRIRGGDNSNDASKRYKLNTETYQVEVGTSYAAGDMSYYWAFVSDNPFQGVKVYNMAAYVKDKTKVLGSSGSGLKIVDASDETYSKQVFKFWYGSYNTERFNLLDADGKSPNIRDFNSWTKVTSDNYSWGQYQRIVEEASIQDPDSYIEADKTTEFNRELLPWIEDTEVGQYFHLKSDVASSLKSNYNIESLKTECLESTFNAINAIISNTSNLVWPETGYYRLHTVNAANTDEQVYLGMNGSNFATFSESTIANNLTTVVKLNRNNWGGAFPYYYTLSGQGRYLYDAIASVGTANAISLVPVGPGKAALFVRWYGAVSAESHVYATCTDNDYVNSTPALVKGASADRNGDTKWTFESATNAELNVALNSIGSETYATLCVPYPYSLSEGTTAYAMELSPSGKEGVYYADLNAIEGIVPAGTPVVLISGEGSNQATLTVNPAGTAAEVGTNVLTGNYLPLTWDAEDLALGRYQDGGNYIPGFYKWSGTTLGANKAYIKADDLPKAGVREIVFRNGETTGIGTALSGSPAEAQGAVYDLQGRRTQAKQPGLYIVNGKKVFIK